jgi:hypothetical protein
MAAFQKKMTEIVCSKTNSKKKELKETFRIFCSLDTNHFTQANAAYSFSSDSFNRRGVDVDSQERKHLYLLSLEIKPTQPTLEC